MVVTRTIRNRFVLSRARGFESHHLRQPKGRRRSVVDVFFASSSVRGGVAQLGERTVRIRKVKSSILSVSTKKKTVLRLSFFIFNIAYHQCDCVYFAS